MSTEKTVGLYHLMPKENLYAPSEKDWRLFLSIEDLADERRYTRIEIEDPSTLQPGMWYEREKKRFLKITSGGDNESLNSMSIDEVVAYRRECYIFDIRSKTKADQGVVSNYDYLRNFGSGESSSITLRPRLVKHAEDIRDGVLFLFNGVYYNRDGPKKAVRYDTDQKVNLSELDAKIFDVMRKEQILSEGHTLIVNVSKDERERMARAGRFLRHKRDIYNLGWALCGGILGAALTWGIQRQPAKIYDETAEPVRVRIEVGDSILECQRREADLKETLEELKTDASTYRSEISKLRGSIGRSDAWAAKAEDESERLANDMAICEADSNLCEAQLEVNRASFSECTAKYQHLAAQKEKEGDRLAGMQSRLSTLEEQAGACTVKLTKADKQREDTTRLLRATEIELRAKNGELETAKRELDGKKKELEKSSEELGHSRTAAERKDAEIARNKGYLEQCLQSVRDTGAVAGDLREQNATCLERIGGLQREITALSQTETGYNRQIASLSKRAEEYESKVKTTGVQYEALATELEILKSEAGICIETAAEDSSGLATLRKENADNMAVLQSSLDSCVQQRDLISSGRARYEFITKNLSGDVTPDKERRVTEMVARFIEQRCAQMDPRCFDETRRQFTGRFYVQADSFRTALEALYSAVVSEKTGDEGVQDHRLRDKYVQAAARIAVPSGVSLDRRATGKYGF